MQDPVAHAPARLEPCQVRGQKSRNGCGEDSGQAELAGSRQRTGRDQNQIRRYRQTRLAAQYRTDYQPIVVPFQIVQRLIHRHPRRDFRGGFCLKLPNSVVDGVL